jgi:[ribosomal protein S18]-alanine N-acetyltransferase
MRLVIRPMGQQNLDRVLVLAGESIEAPRWTRHDYEQILHPPADAAVIRSAWVAVCERSVVGFAAASWLRGETAAELENLVVDQGYRRQGIGAALLGECGQWAARAGASILRLEVRASNAAALALYHRCGFSAAGVRRAYYSAPVEDALLLQVPLGA